MSAAVVAAVGLVGGLGAIGRFLVQHHVEQHLGREFPFGTLAVNVSGAFALGVVVGLAPSEDVYRVLAVGLLGAFTTFSTWAFESYQLADEGRRRRSAANFALSLLLGVLAVWAGRRLGIAV